MQYFKSEFIDFFKELAANNSKTWFDAHRSSYEENVKKTFSIFIQDLIVEIKKFDTSITPDAKDAIFRINRDIRFSKDKTPYKLFTSALLSSTGRKDISNPGFYMEFNPEEVILYGGIYMPDAVQISKIRTHMILYEMDFKEIISNKDFIDKFGFIKGDQQKRLPLEFKTAAEKIPLLYNKQWFIQAHFDADIIIKDNLMETIIDYYKTADSLHQFIKSALQ